MDELTKLITDNLPFFINALETRVALGGGTKKKLVLFGIRKLRELILELAVRGKLVPQDESDEPASRVLERVAEEKVLLLKEKKIKKGETLPEIEEGEKPFVLPPGWEWTKLGDLIEMYNGRIFNINERSQKGLPIVRIQNLNNIHAEFNHCDVELAPQHRIDTNSFLISWSGNPGTSWGAFVWKRGKAALNQGIYNCLFHRNDVEPEFICMAVNSSITQFISMVQGSVGVKHLTQGALYNIIIAFPPLPEQKRIVAKANELTELCDRVESRTNSGIAAHETLVARLLKSLTESSDSRKLTENWNRIAMHFETLFITESSIEKLKQTLLHLAVMGKLVPQDENDESVPVLEKIAEEETRRMKIAVENNRRWGRRLNKVKKALPEVTDDEKSFELPRGWEWSRVASLGEIQVGRKHSLENHIGPHMVPLLRMANVYDARIDISDVKEMNIPPEKQEHYRLKFGDILLNEGQSSELIGRSAMYRDEVPGACFQSTLFRYRVSPVVTSDYCLLYFRMCFYSGRFQKTVTHTKKMAHLSIFALARIEFPVPPLAEQKRIVAKVNELTAICDQLKERIAESRRIQKNFVDTLVEQVLG